MDLNLIVFNELRVMSLEGMQVPIHLPVTGQIQIIEASVYNRIETFKPAQETGL